MQVYQHSFRVAASQQAVVEFHQHSSSMGAITPPPIIVKVHRAPERLGEGDGMEFTLWFGPIPISWKAKIEGVSSEGFIDRQEDGPFKTWEHIHRFIRINDQETEIVDQVKYELKAHPWWGFIGLGMAVSLPILFAFRGWKTRRILTSRIRNRP